MADATVTFIASNRDASESAAIMDRLVNSIRDVTGMNIALTGAVTGSLSAGYEALDQLSVSFRPDVMVFFGKTRQSLGCEFGDRPMFDEVEEHRHKLPNDNHSTLVLSVPSTKRGWWLDDSNHIEVGNAIVAECQRVVLSLGGSSDIYRSN